MDVDSTPATPVSPSRTDDAAPRDKFRFCIDRGGTFTDVYAEVPGGKPVVLKLLSEDPDRYPDAPTEGIRRILETSTGVPHPRGVPVDTSRIEFIRMGTTVATNALLERKGARMALAVTAGFRDVLVIGNQARPAIFDLRVSRPGVLFESVIEIDERVLLDKDAAPGPAGSPASTGLRTVIGVTGERFIVEKEPNAAQVRAQLQAVFEAGISSLAILLLHSYAYDAHERVVASIAREIGFIQVSTSAATIPMVRAVPRGFTVCADAYLTPAILKYVQGFRRGFDAALESNQTRVLFMQSDGGLARADKFSGHKAILSGPAGGVVGYSMTAYAATGTPVIGFDMGGTSTDVSRYAGTFEHVYETTTAGITVQAPQLDINTVAAGGGSRLFFKSGRLVVGPESAGAHPGPVCYRKGGFAAVTDANLVLGRLQPDMFPAIFGPHENEPLDSHAAFRALQELTEQVNAAAPAGSSPKSVDEVAHGFLAVANEAMCRPIRSLTTMRGYDAAKHTLAVFGGAGGQHACAVARALGMKRVFVHRYSGILSAYGLALADVVEEQQCPAADVLGTVDKTELGCRLLALAHTVVTNLTEQGFTAGHIHLHPYLHLRFRGTDTSIMTRVQFTLHAADVESLLESRALPGAFIEALSKAGTHFVEHYRREFGFTLADRDVLIDDLRVRGVGTSGTKVRHEPVPSGPKPSPIAARDVYFEGGRVSTPLFAWASLSPGHDIPGPAVIVDATSTLVVEPGCTAHMTADGDVEVMIPSPTDAAIAGGATPMVPSTTLTSSPDVVMLSIFGHRFMSIAEQMGRTLQRTAISVNIKERLDFSCALFGPDGGLVANAPHIPVHLGAMQQAVRYQLAHWGDDLHEGDVLVSNHPQLAGGSHLPDITVITPCFNNGHIVFFVASRGHHADIGGITPGSMPPNSKLLAEEGAAIIAFKLVKDGVFQEAGITELLMAPATNGIPGCAGSRNLHDCLSDLQAQVAANQQGIRLVKGLIDEYSEATVVSYMHHIQANAAEAVRDMLVQFSLAKHLPVVGSVSASDFMDDGTPIVLKITIDREQRTAEFDFEGTGCEVFGNANAPPAVTHSAIIYSLRCLVGADIPLNQGCLHPVTIKIPAGSILHPSPTAGVVGGNVLTSQRVVDVVLRAFGACAASQGCMNNLTFGDATMGYYETIAGGAGAGPDWNGTSGVHTHMTNTRITDPETLERRYPVILRQFGLRTGSGGAGAKRGGDGVVRVMQCRRPLSFGILSERRAFQPYGIAGGEPGARGRNLVQRVSGHMVSLGGKATIQLDTGDSIIIETPGGGGFGAVAASFV